MRDADVVVVGIGSPILRDDGVGLHVARRAAELLSDANVVVTEAAVGGLGLLDTIVGYRAAILVDASCAGRPAGSCERFHVQAAGRSLRLSYQHGVSFAQAIEFGRQCGAAMPDPVVAYAVEAADPYTFDQQMTPAVAQAVEPVARRVAAEARRLANAT